MSICFQIYGEGKVNSALKIIQLQTEKFCPTFSSLTCAPWTPLLPPFFYFKSCWWESQTMWFSTKHDFKNLSILNIDLFDVLPLCRSPLSIFFSKMWHIIPISKDHFCPIRANQKIVGWVSFPFYFCSMFGDKSFWLRANQPARRRWRWALGNYPPTHTTFQIEILEISHFTDDTFKCPTYSFHQSVIRVWFIWISTQHFSVSSPDVEVRWVTLLFCIGFSELCPMCWCTGFMWYFFRHNLVIDQI